MRRYAEPFIRKIIEENSIRKPVLRNGLFFVRIIKKIVKIAKEI